MDGTSRQANISEAIDRLRAARPAIRHVELLLPDLNGILRGKRCTLKELEGIARSGLSYPASGYLLDSRGSLIDGLVHGSEDGDPDYLRPCRGRRARSARRCSAWSTAMAARISRTAGRCSRAWWRSLPESACDPW
jgi:glutamine synthetase